MRWLDNLVEVDYILDILDNDSVLENMLQGDILLIESHKGMLEKLTPVLLAFFQPIKPIKQE